jgi:hypothetical protein
MDPIKINDQIAKRRREIAALQTKRSWCSGVFLTRPDRP